MISFRRTSLALAALVTAVVAGCAAPTSEDTSSTSEEVRQASVTMPKPIVSFLKANDWGTHHLEWHTVRNWDRLGSSDQEWAKKQGWSRADLQEGQKGNGLEFLAMHRVMFRILKENFPESASLFDGWNPPPTDPSDAFDPVPKKNPKTFDSDKADAIDKLQNHLDEFENDDELGLYIETSLRPTSDDPNARTSDKSSGIHNYLHNRFSGDSKTVNIGDPSVNLQNKRFWRLHGWIESRWTEFRRIKGLSESDPRYAAALAKGEAMLKPRSRGLGSPDASDAPESLRMFFVNNND